MGKVTLCQFVLCGKATPVFWPGDAVIGNVILKVTGEISANAVKIFCKGASLTKWSPLFTRTNASVKESYISETISLVGGKGSAVTLTEGTHTYPFCFDLPVNGLPSSYEGDLGAIRYWLKLQVDKTFPGIDFVQYKVFTVLTDKLNVGLSPCLESNAKRNKKTLSKFLGFGNAGELSLSASLDKIGYCPGEKICINLEAKNESTKDCGKIRAKFMQRVLFSVGEETETQMTLLTDVTKEAETLKKAEKIVWNNVSLVIPAVPPSSQPRTCHNIDLIYFVRVEVEVGGGFDLELDLPVLVGTIPKGTTKSKTKFKLDDGRIYDRIKFTPPLTYTECTKGFRHCSKSDSDLPFPSLTYTPYTVFNDGSATTAPTSKAKATPTASPSTKGQIAQGASSTPAVPSAPVMDPHETLPKYSAIDSGPDAPPSYDSIFTPSTSGSTINANPSAGRSEPKQEWKGAVLGLIFPQIQLVQMTETMASQSSNLASSDGIMLGVFDKFPLFSFKTSSAIFVVFPSEKSAMTWFDHFQWSNPIPDMHVLFAENAIAKPRPMDPSLYPIVHVNMNYKTRESQLSKEEKTEYFELIKKIFNPLKEKFAGKNIINTLKVKYVSGDWSDLPCAAKDISLIIHHWPSRDHLIGYSNGCKEHQGYNRYQSLSSRNYSISVRAETDLSTSSDSSECNQYWRGAALGLVFSQSDMAKAMEHIKTNLKSLAASNGRVIAVFDKFLLTPSSALSAIFVIFPSEAVARVWIRQHQSSNPIQDMKVMYSENYLPLAKPMDSKLYPAISVTISYKTDYKNDQELKELSSLSKTIFRPCREQFGGKHVIVAKETKFLCGDWSSDIPHPATNVTLVIAQWASTAHQEAFVNEVKVHPDYSQYENLKDKFYYESKIFVTLFKEDEMVGSLQ